VQCVMRLMGYIFGRVVNFFPVMKYSTGCCVLFFCPGWRDTSSEHTVGIDLDAKKPHWMD
jgi:hypothetical protein